MVKQGQYYLIRAKAVPEVLLSVVEAKHLLESGRAATVQEATEMVGISRSSFYKYKDDIFPFHDESVGKTVTMMLTLDDEPGLLSRVTKRVAEAQANILTIHQTIPVGGLATLTLSLQVDEDLGVEDLIDELEKLSGVHKLKILARS
ncbi:MAG: ACT domain-containing protein [Lachnospiraceae bacterium]|nr:ACT domain-containing protein [Lachnospiraceae bacterium]